MKPAAKITPIRGPLLRCMASDFRAEARMTEAREAARRIVACFEVDTADAQIEIDALTVARALLAIESTQDAREVAQEIADEYAGKMWHAQHDKCVDAITAALTSYATAAVLKEREACAKVADEIWEKKDAHPNSFLADCGYQIAKAIRTRGAS